MHISTYIFFRERTICNSAGIFLLCSAILDKDFRMNIWIIIYYVCTWKYSFLHKYKL